MRGRSRRDRSATAGRTVFNYSGVNPGVNSSNAPNILGKSYTITADVDVPQGGGDGVLATHGGTLGRMGTAHAQGQVFDYNMLILAQYRWEEPDALTPGKHTIVFDRVSLGCVGTVADIGTADAQEASSSRSIGED